LETKKLGTVRTLLRIFPYAKKALPRVVLGTLAAIGGHMFALAIPGYLRSLFDTLESNTNFDTLLFAVFAVLGLGLLESVMVLLRRWLVLTPGTHVEAGLRRTLYAKLQDLEVAFHDRWPSGQLLSRASSDLSMIRRWLSFGLVLLVANLFTIVVGFTLLFSYNWILATVFVVIMSPLWVLGFRFEKEYHVTARMSQDQAGDLATSVEESVHGIRVIKSFGRGSFMTEKFARDALKLRGTELNKAKMVANLWFYFSTIPSLATGIYLPLGVWQIVEGNMTIGVLLSFILTTRILHWPIDSLGFLLSMTIDARSAVERFFEVIDTKVDISDPESPKTIKEPKGRLVFENVSFRYADAPAEQKDLIDGVNLEIEPGESVALIGITGSGKTSLTALATRLYEVTGGSVKLDGVDVRDLSREELRAHVAMAFEDSTLFSDTIRNNVLLGRPESTEEELAQALEIAQAGFVYDLPDGLDTKIGEEGLSLSGGQRQRIALARAVAAQPAVLVLDDPLSALDVDTEAMVEDALRTVLKATTALIVAHRPSTVQLADKVALLQDGKITAFGKHSDLIATNDHYRYVISSLDAAGKMIEVNK
jgi:ATP-binding cassette subfamily B protein